MRWLSIAGERSGTSRCNRGRGRGERPTRDSPSCPGSGGPAARAPHRRCGRSSRWRDPLGGQRPGKLLFRDAEPGKIDPNKEEPVRRFGPLDHFTKARGREVGDPLLELGDQRSPAGDRCRELAQLDPADRRFELGHPVVQAEEQIFRLARIKRLAPIGKALRVPVDRLVVGHHHVHPDRRRRCACRSSG